jgi:uncharacterized membrane protein YeiH
MNQTAIKSHRTAAQMLRALALAGIAVFAVSGALAAGCAGWQLTTFNL